ncbi:Hsc70-interacting protein, partial [Trichinella pseudospiralis]
MMAFTSQNWSDTVISNVSYQPASINDSTPSVTTTSYCHGLKFQHSDAQFSYYIDDDMRWYAQNLEGYWYYQGPDGEFVLWDSTVTGKDGSNYKTDSAVTAAVVDDDIPPPPPPPPPPSEVPLPSLESPPPPPESPTENSELDAVASESSLVDVAASSVEISSSAAEPEAAHQLDTGSDVVNKDDKDQESKAAALFIDEEGRPKFPVNADGKPMLPFGPEGKRVFPLGPDNKPIFPVDQNNQPVFPVNEDGMPVFPTGPNNTAIVPVDSQGKPVFPLGANMQPLHPVDSFGNMMMPVKVTDGSPAYFPNADGQRVTSNDGNRKELLFDNAQMWNQSLSYYNNYNYGYATYTTYYSPNPTYTSTWANSGRKTKVRPEDIDMPVGPPPPPPVLQVPFVSDITNSFDSSYMTNIINISGNSIFSSITNNNQNNVSINSSIDNSNITNTDNSSKNNNNNNNNNNSNNNNSSTASSAVNMPVDLSLKSSVEPLLTEEKRQASKSLISRQLKQKRAIIKPEHRLSPDLMSLKSAADQPKKLSEEQSAAAAAASPERHSWRSARGSEGASKRRRRWSVSTSVSESGSRRRKRSRIRDVGEDDDESVYKKRRRRSNNRRRSRKVYKESYRRRQRRHRSTSADSSNSNSNSSSNSSSTGTSRVRSSRSRSNSSSSSSSGGGSSANSISGSSNSSSSNNNNNNKSTATPVTTNISSASSSNTTTTTTTTSTTTTTTITTSSRSSSNSSNSSSSSSGTLSSHTPAESTATLRSNGSDRHLSKRRCGRSSASASRSLPTSDDSGPEQLHDKMIPTEQVNLLRSFVQQCKKYPSLLHNPRISFYKEYLERYRLFGFQFSDADVMEPEEEMSLPFGDESVELTEEMIVNCDVKQQKAMEAAKKGDYEQALKLYSEAICLNPLSTLLYGRRAWVLLNLKKPMTAIRDCTKAINLNPNAAIAYKYRGKAYRMLGRWEDAYYDLCNANNLDYNEECYQWLKEVEEY